MFIENGILEKCPDVMLEKFKAFIEKNQLIRSDEVVLVALSGGVDSVVLCDLLLKSKRPFFIAHCNFQLRGKESDEDEKWVRNYAKENQVPFEIRRFNTEVIAKKRKKGIQEVARDLRYEWFHEILREEKAHVLATAHHKNDSVETMLFNLTRGSGIEGLKGIEIKRDQIIRPMMFAEKEEILAYAKSNRIDFRQDASNASEKYSRNKIRHTIIPELKNLNQSLIKTMYEKSKIFAEGADLMNAVIDAELDKELKVDGEAALLSIKHVKTSKYPRLLLWRWLSGYQFSSPQMEEVLSLSEAQTGKKLESTSHVLTLDREHLVLIEKKENLVKELVFDDLLSLESDARFKVSVLEKEKWILSKSNLVAQFDASKIIFPLVLRRWRAGDSFQPLGMKGQKKIKEFLTQEKVRTDIKKEVQVLCSKDQILWVVGFRVDDRFRVQNSSEKVLIVEKV